MAEYRMNDWRKLASVVRDARKKGNRTQGELAEQAGVSRAWLAKLESGGHRRAELEQVFRVLDALGLSLVARDESPRNATENAVLDALAKVGRDVMRPSLTTTGRERIELEHAQRVADRSAARLEAAQREADQAQVALETAQARTIRHGEVRPR